MATELVTFKMDTELLKDVDQTSKSAGFQSRTEFIRSALREKIEEIRLKQAMIELSKYRGKAGKQTSDEHRRKVREQVGKELLAEYEKRFK